MYVLELDTIGWCIHGTLEFCARVTSHDKANDDIGQCIDVYSFSAGFVGCTIMHMSFIELYNFTLESIDLRDSIICSFHFKL